MFESRQEKRQFPRAAFPCRIVIDAPMRLLISHTENIGAEGIGVILEEKLRVDTPVGLEIFLERHKPIKCKGKVQWIEDKLNPVENKAVLFETGIVFTDIDRYDKEYIRNVINALNEQKKKA